MAQDAMGAHPAGVQRVCDQPKLLDAALRSQERAHSACPWPKSPQAPCPILSRLHPVCGTEPRGTSSPLTCHRWQHGDEHTRMASHPFDHFSTTGSIGRSDRRFDTDEGGIGDIGDRGDDASLSIWSHPFACSAFLLVIWAHIF